MSTDPNAGLKCNRQQHHSKRGAIKRQRRQRFLGKTLCQGLDSQIVMLAEPAQVAGVPEEDIPSLPRRFIIVPLERALAWDSPHQMEPRRATPPSPTRRGFQKKKGSRRIAAAAASVAASGIMSSMRLNISNPPVDTPGDTPADSVDDIFMQSRSRRHPTPPTRPA